MVTEDKEEIIDDGKKDSVLITEESQRTACDSILVWHHIGLGRRVNSYLIVDEHFELL